MKYLYYLCKKLFMDILKIKKMKSDDIRLEASQRLIEMLSNIEHSIAYNLLDRIRYKEYGRVSFLDFGNENDNISYIINNKFFELTDNNPENWREKVWVEKRTNLKIGKFIKMIYEDQFPVNQPKDVPAPKPRVDIESFVNMFKAEREKNVNYTRFEVVNGDDIRKWYKQDNYSRFANSETPLGKSCMRYAESSKFLKMYSTNKNIFSMLILKDDAGKLKGRALVWNLELPKGRIFMDRIYTVNDYDIEIFKQYAKDNGWLYRVEQRFGWFNKIADPTNGVIYESKDLLLQVTLTKCPEIDYEFYPYLDTLSIYNKETHILNNNGDLRRKSGHILLTDYQGRYHSEVDERPRVYSSIYNEDILEEDAIYVEIDDTYCIRGEEVTVSNTNGKLAYRNSPKIVQSYILGNTKYFLKEDCIYSEYLNTYIYKTSAVDAFMDEEQKTPVIIHKNLIGIVFEEKDGIILYSKELVKKKEKEEALRYKKAKKSVYGSYDSYGWIDSAIFNDIEINIGSTNSEITSRPTSSEEVRPEPAIRTRHVSSDSGLSAEPIRRSRPVSNDEFSDMFESPHPEPARWTNVTVSRYDEPVAEESVENTNSLNSNGAPIDNNNNQNDVYYGNVRVNDELFNQIRRYGYIDSESINSYYDTTLRQLYNDFISRRRRR